MQFRSTMTIVKFKVEYAVGLSNTSIVALETLKILKNKKKKVAPCN